MEDRASSALGRGLIVAPGDPVPSPWADAPRVRVDDDALTSPTGPADALHAHWSQRTPVVVEVGVPVETLRAPETDDRPPYELTPQFEFARERLYFLARANNYDGRGGRFVWGLGLEAARLGARVEGPADVVLPDGSPAWCDGGPRLGSLPVEGAVVHRVRIDSGRLTPDRDAPVVADLAPDQRAAVAHTGGAARIIAPAGSGKTRVLTERFRLLASGRGWGTEALCAVAYNVRAKAEMEQRLADLGPAAQRKVRTLHALGFDALRRAGTVRDVLSEWDVRRRIEALAPVRPRANTDVLAPYLEALGEVRLGLVPPAQVENKRDDVEGFTEMFDRYRDGLARDQVVDHDEQIYGALEVLLTDPEIRRAFQSECRHLLVDEFQDLTPAQLLLLRLVSAPAYDVFGVGDDDQVIYGYAGADPVFLIAYDRYFPGAAHLQLEVNYRSPTTIAAAAATLLGHNRRRVAKEIRAAKHDAVDALITERCPAERMPGAVIDRVQTWIDGGAESADIAVLSRVRSALLPVQVLAAEAGIPANAPVGADVLTRTGVRTALAWLQVVTSYDADAMGGGVVADAARRPSRSLRREVIDRLRNRRRWTRAALLSFADSTKGRLDEFCADVDALAGALRRGATTEILLRAIRDQIGLGSALDTLDRGGRGPEASHLDDLNALLAVAALAPDPAAFEPWLRNHLGSPRPDAAPGEVTLSTVHRVKGMEWPYVIVLGAHDGLMPHHLADDVEEERRVFHVALTRADTAVYLIGDENAGDRFVHELREVAPPTPAVAAAAPVRERPKRARTGVVAEPQLILTFSGSTGPIIEVRADGVLIAADDGSNVFVPYEERVEHEGRRGPLLPPADRPVPAADGALVDALKQWRLERANVDGVPAFVVLHDSHLVGIAARRPTTLDTLSRCPGIGATKLERYGDEIIAIVADASE